MALHRETKWIERFFGGSLAPGRWPLLYRHLAECRSCDHRFHVALAAFRALGRAAHERAPGRAEIDLIGEQVLGAVARRTRRPRGAVR